MPRYRLYRLHPESGHFMGVEEIDAADDGAAIREIHRRGSRSVVELWHGARKVIRLDTLPEGVASPPGPESQALH